MQGLVIRTVVACAVAGSGCGRIGFGPIDDATGDARGASAGDSDVGTSSEMLTIPAAADTALNSFAANLNYGGAMSFNVRADAVSTFVGLIRFELSGAPGSVASATLRIRTSNQALSAGRIEVLRVLEAWDEGTQTGGTGFANYALRQTTASWTSPGCGPGSRDDAPIGELQPFAADTLYEVTLSSAVVQAWIANPPSNHGIALAAVGTGNDTVAFFARESAMAPELVVHLVR